MTEKDNNIESVSQNSTLIEPEIINTDKTQEKLSSKDEVVLIVAKENPTLNNNQLGNKLKEMGVIKHKNTIYKRLTKNAYLTLSLDEIRKNHAECMTREIVPEALKVHKRVLKDKSIPDKQKTKWVEMAEKAEFKTESPQVSRTVNINVYEKVQQNLLNVCQDRLDGKED